MAAHIHDALAQVRRLQGLIIERHLFRGYSGKARLASGCVALAGAVVLSSGRVPATPSAHLAGWGVVLALGVAINYASLAYWFLFDPDVRRNPRMLAPALDAVPALAAGAALSAALVAAGRHELLFGAWLCLYGLAQTAYRRTLPPGIHSVGLGYVAAGMLLLLPGAADFMNPWPAALAFFAGETAGGLVLMRNRMADVHDVHNARAGDSRESTP
jgi:hypothetical protein